MSAVTRIRVRGGAVLTLSVVALCAAPSPATSSSPHHERVPLQLLNSFPLNPRAQATPQQTTPSAGSPSRRASPVRPRLGRRHVAAKGVPAILIAVVAVFVSLLALAGVLAAARRRARGEAVRFPRLAIGPAVRFPPVGNGAAVPFSRPAAGGPPGLRFNRLRYTDPQRRCEGASAGAAAFRRGLLLEEEGDLIGAEKAYRDAAKRGHLGAESNLGVLLHQRGEFESAKQHYRRALEGGEPAGAFNLGVLLEEQRDLAAARSAYRRADQRGHAAAASNLGVLLEENGLLALALAAYSRADERGDPKGAVNLGMTLEEQGDLEAAQAAYGRAVDYRQAGEATSTREASGAPRASA